MDISKWMKKHPFKASIIALLIGALVSWIFVFSLSYPRQTIGVGIGTQDPFLTLDDVIFCKRYPGLFILRNVTEEMSCNRAWRNDNKESFMEEKFFFDKYHQIPFNTLKGSYLIERHNTGKMIFDVVNISDGRDWSFGFIWDQ